MELDHHWLLEQLNIDAEAPGVFGVCYSILTASTMTHGCTTSARGFGNSLVKIVEGGHATTFLWVRSTDVFIRAAADHSGWGFSQQAWARQTPSATTYVYYIEVDQDFIERYKQVAKRLMGLTNIRYSQFRPNVCTSNDYQNCVSTSHRLMAELGLGSQLMARGYWTPTTANWINWISTFSPRRVGDYTWKYRVFPVTNTLVGSPLHRSFSEDALDLISPESGSGRPMVAIAL